ncbi:MAG TPA: ABC transporter permease subunit [Thermoanaerobaculia bacterium]
MFLTLFRKEVLLQLLSSRFVFSVVIGTLLLTGSSWVLLHDHGDDVRSYRQFEAEHARQIGSYETGADTPLGALSMGGRIVDRRPPELAFLISGVYRALPKSFWLSNFDGPTPETNLVGNRLRELFAAVDFRFVVGVIFSLLALLLSYDAINGERQSGTLKLTLTNPVSLRTFLFAKWASLNAVLAIAFLLAFLLSLGLALFSPAVSLSGAGMLRLALIAAISLLYLAVFVTLGLLVSTIFRDPYPAVSAALLVWVLLVYVIPGAAPYLAAMREPEPDYVRTATARQDRLGYDYREIRKSYLARGLSKKEATAATRKYWSEVVEPLWAANVARNNEQFLNQKSRVVERGRSLARVSPYGGFSFAVTELALVGAGEQLRFERAVERYRRTFHEFIREQQALGRDKEVRASDVPPFRFESRAAAGQDVLVEVAVLAAFVLLFFSAAFVKMLRYDVR